MYLHVINFSWKVHGLLNPTMVYPIRLVNYMPKCRGIPDILVIQNPIYDGKHTYLNKILL